MYYSGWAHIIPVQNKARQPACPLRTANRPGSNAPEVVLPRQERLDGRMGGHGRLQDSLHVVGSLWVAEIWHLGWDGKSERGQSMSFRVCSAWWHSQRPGQVLSKSKRASFARCGSLLGSAPALVVKGVEVIRVDEDAIEGRGRGQEHVQLEWVQTGARDVCQSDGPYRSIWETHARLGLHDP